MAHRIAYQGIEGSYSHQAIREAAKALGLSLEPVPRHSFRDLFDAIKDDTGLGLVPIENSIAGSVVQCYDLFLDYDATIIGEFEFKIEHCLLSNYPEEDITTVYSHPQALSQCSDYLDARKYEKVVFSDTAGAAKHIARVQQEGAATVASEAAAEIYGLGVVARNIQNNGENRTRFLLVKKAGTELSFEDQLQPRTKSTILFEAADIPAALYKCLGGFATNGVNLLKIESRPSQKKNFDYIFYLDFEGTKEDEGVRNALDELDHFSKKVVFLGSYHRLSM